MRLIVPEGDQIDMKDFLDCLILRGQLQLLLAES